MKLSWEQQHAQRQEKGLFEKYSLFQQRFGCAELF